MRAKSNQPKHIDIDDFISDQSRQEVIQQAAKLMMENLQTELAQTSLSERQKQAISRSIKVSASNNEEITIRVSHPLASELEFGTSTQDEHPWLLRAKQKTQRDLASFVRQKGSAT